MYIVLQIVEAIQLSSPPHKKHECVLETRRIRVLFAKKKLI